MVKAPELHNSEQLYWQQYCYGLFGYFTTLFQLPWLSKSKSSGLWRRVVLW